MIKEIQREFKRQLQEMVQFKFNLIFANFGIVLYPILPRHTG